MKKILHLIAFVSYVSILGGCAAPANQQAMSIRPDQAKSITNKKLQKLFEVGSVTGGKETNPMWTSQVDNTSFKQALVDSLKNLNYLATTDKPVYKIDATLQELKQPIIGLTFDVTSQINYRVDGPGLNKNFPITATGSATMSDAFLGIERLRIANERSIQENIKSFIEALSNEKLMQAASQDTNSSTSSPAPNIRAKCADLGFAVGSPEFNNCTKKLTN
jgi:hypothetical protein